MQGDWNKTSLNDWKAVVCDFQNEIYHDSSIPKQHDSCSAQWTDGLGTKTNRLGLFIYILSYLQDNISQKRSDTLYITPKGYIMYAS